MSSPRLPPFGFREGLTTMESLRNDIPLLYRVITERSHFGYIEGRGFTVARRSNMRPLHNIPGVPSRNEVMDYINGQHGDFRIIETTASLATALWWAQKMSSGGEREVRIAVIDASQVALRSYTALECIRPSRQNGPRNEWISKCENFARAMQFVFVKGDIPDYAVVSVQYWEMIEVDLPSWYLPEPGERWERGVKEYYHAVRERFDTTGGPLSRTGWEATIASAKTILGFDNRKLNQIECSRLAHVAWYLLTFPVADWPERHRHSLPFTSHRYPGQEYHAQFKVHVKRRLGLGDEDGLPATVSRRQDTSDQDGRQYREFEEVQVRRVGNISDDQFIEEFTRSFSGVSLRSRDRY